MSIVRRQLASILVLVLVFASLALSAYFDACRINWTSVDFGPYLAAANRMRDQDPLYVFSKDHLYTGQQYLYPPLPALAMKPFAGANLNTAGRIWTAIDVVLLVGIVFLYCWAVKLHPVKDLATTLLLGAVAFNNYPARLEILIGNIDLLILLCLVGVMLFSRLKRWKQAALLISLAASIKTWAIAFVLYLFIMRKSKEAILSIFAFLAAGAAMFALLGLDEFEIFLKVQKAYLYQPKLNSNSIIPMCRLYSGNPNLEHHRPPILFPGAETFLPVFGVIASIAVIAAFLVVAWRAYKSPLPRQMPLLFSFFIITFLLLTPICHQYYYVLALPAIWNLIVFADSSKRLGRKIEEDWVGVAMWAGALTAIVLLLVESPGLTEPDAFVGFARLAPLGYGTTIVAGIALWLTTALALVCGRPIEETQLAYSDSVLLPENDHNQPSTLQQAVH